MKILKWRIPGTRDKAREIELLKERVREAQAAIQKEKEELIALEAERRKLQRQLATLHTRQMAGLILICKEQHN